MEIRTQVLAGIHAVESVRIDSMDSMVDLRPLRVYEADVCNAIGKDEPGGANPEKSGEVGSGVNLAFRVSCRRAALGLSVGAERWSADEVAGLPPGAPEEISAAVLDMTGTWAEDREKIEEFATSEEGLLIAIMHISGCPIAVQQSDFTEVQQAFLTLALPRAMREMRNGDGQQSGESVRQSIKDRSKQRVLQRKKR